MFTNITILRAALAAPIDFAAATETAEFAECSPTQEFSIGFVPPRGEAHGAMVEFHDQSMLLRVQVEAKKVPADALKRKVQQRCDEIERETGRKPGKKERRDLTDETRLALLPTILPVRKAVGIWIDPGAGRIIIDTCSAGLVDEIISLMIKAFDGLVVRGLNTVKSPAASMSHWLVSDDAPAGFTVDRECELRAVDASKAVVRYANHALDLPEVAQHIRGGKIPARLAMTWQDRVSFVLTDSLQLRKLQFLDGVFDGRRSDADYDAFDADVAIMTGEVSGLLADLVRELGGELQPEGQAKGADEGEGE